MEKNHELYPHEEELLCRIFDEIEAGNLSILISGPKGVGKTYVTEKYLGSQDINTYLAIKFNGENAVDQESYFVLKEGLSSKVGKQIKTERMQDISMLVRESGIKVPFLGAFVDIFHSSHKRSFDNFYYKYDSTAKDIIFKLKYLAEHKELIIICYGLENWDRMSLKLLYNILNSRNEDFSFLSTTIIICTCSSEKTENIDIIQAIKNSSGVKEIPTYINEDQFEGLVSNIYPDGKFDNRPLGYLHKITEGNISVLKNIFDCIKDGYDIDENHVSDSLSIVKEFIYNKIKTEFPSDDSIKASMEIGALLGLFFSTNELQEVVGWDDGKFQAEIEHAVEMGLVNRNWTDGDGDKIRFVHNVIRQAFKFGGKALSIEYNQKIASALSIIAPNQYKRRSSFEESSKQHHKATVLKLLSLIQSYKRKEKPDYKDRETTFIFVSDYYPSLWKYYEFIEKGYASYNNDIYDDSLSSVSFEGAPIELRVERAILYSMICTKNRDFAARDKGIIMLEPFSKSVESCGSELFLYEQVLMRMVVLYAHSGEIKRARELEEKLVASLMQRINTDNSATQMLYSLHRISNALYDSEVALHKIHSSMQFFKGSYSEKFLPCDINGYYMSLVNYAAILCNCGKFQESAVVLDEIDIYKRNFDGFPFHRERIEMNNRIIINYLSGKATAKECKAAYEELVKKSEGIAEGIFYKSNYAIFMALDGEIEAAYKLLSKVLLLNDKEQRYNYRINVNLASFAYLCGKVEEALIRLEETLAWFNTSNTTDSIYQKKRLLLLLDYINKNVTAPAPTEWDAIHIGGRSSHYQATPHDYYERGFVYTIVYHWDI